MTSQKRRLAAILIADVVGYSRLMGDDEEATVAVLGDRREVFRERVENYNGRVVDTAGDSVLCVFDSVVEAVRCAVEIQITLSQRNAELSEDRRMRFRIGVNLGDIIEKEDGTVYGDGVNVAARMEALAEPGGVTLSEDAYRQVRAKLEVTFEDMGDQEVKNIAQRIRAFRLVHSDLTPTAPASQAPSALPEPGDWKVDLGEIKKSVLAGRLPRIPRSRPVIAGVVAFFILFGIAGLYVLIQDRGESLSPESVLAGEAAPGLAVLPFTVQGQDLEVLREGMVSLVSTVLDGAAGLRTISPRTVFARWRERVSGEETPDLATLLEIAHDTGARYALVGSAVGIGSNTRLVANVYNVETGDRLGQARSEGSSDDVLSLVDRLGVEVLSVILNKGEEELPEIDLASLTTDSPEALMAYLEGEVHFRHLDIEAAREAYTRAVGADSMFALAHSRLYLAYSWEPMNPALASLHSSRAAQFSDRLPAREAMIVRANQAMNFLLVDEVEALRAAVRTYPDDAEIWIALGETLMHVPGALAPAEEVDAAFERAVQLDPGNALYLAHYMDFAWTLHADSQEAARRLGMFERATSEQNTHARAGRIALDLAFGDSTAQADAMARLETEDYDVVTMTRVFLNHPRFRQNIEVNRMRFRRADDDQVIGAWLSLEKNLTYYGQFHELLELLEDPRIESGLRALELYWLLDLGFPVPAESLEEAMESIAIDSTASRNALRFAGRYAADQARWLDHERAIAELERRALADAGSLGRNRRAKRLRGYGLWKRSDPEAALSILGDPDLGSVDRLWWLGQLYQELGHFRDAERVYRSYFFFRAISIHPLAHRELGGIYEELGEYDKAREAYEYFVEYWNEADPELQPMVEEARQAIVRLQQM